MLGTLTRLAPGAIIGANVLLDEEIVIEPPRPRPGPKEKKKRRQPITQTIDFIDPSQGTHERHVLTDEELDRMFGALAGVDDDVFLAMALLN